MKNNALKITLKIIAFILLLALLASIAIYFALSASLPQLSGDAPVAKLSKPVTVARDALGTAIIRATDMTDAMRALGYVHAQERFFEMDLTRRSSAGELSALFGAAAISMDKEKRAHRFRFRMASIWRDMPAADPAGANLLNAYTEGVNSGLNALNTKPWQYTLLRATPNAWTEIDSLLVMAEMFYMLQSKPMEQAFDNALLREKLGDTLFSWLKPLGGTWDAALDGSVIAPAAMPDATQLNVRNIKPEQPNIGVAAAQDNAMIGSNAWAVGGALTAHGGGMLANDMHLNLGVPNIWFRTQIEIAAEPTNTARNAARRIAGVSLPGVPAMVAGSNGDVAWGYTNSYGKWLDWVQLPADEIITTHVERIDVKGGEAITLDVRETRLGPVLKTVDKQAYALNWIGHRTGAFNMMLTKLVDAKTVDEALHIAQQSGGPHQNVFIVDRHGNLAWTIMGRMPARALSALSSTLNGNDASLRAGFAAPESLNNDWLAPAQYPAIKNPADHRLWSGNNRQLAHVGGALIGEGGFDLGARGQQIRDRLREQSKFDEAALYKIQLDTEARFMKRWVALAIKAAEANRESPNALASLRALNAWNGHADVDEAGYRIARSFRLKVMDALWKSWLNATPAARLKIKSSWDNRFEYAAWQAMGEEAPHLLPQPFEQWHQFLSAQLSAVNAELLSTNPSLGEATWGRRNITAIRHPISRAVPQLGYFLDMPAMPLSGDNHLPKVASPNFGASERMVIAPGHEDTAIMTMPGGQSGHPLSPFYGAGYQDWLEGKPAPLLAGVAKYTLALRPVEIK